MITSVKVGLFDYTISEVETPGGEDKNLHAYIRFGDCKIELRSDLNSNMKTVALLHEILHAIGRQSGLEYEGGEYTEERFVIAFSHGLVALLRENPELVKYLTNGD